MLLNAGSREFRVPASVLKKCGNKEGSSGDGKADKKAGTDKRSIPENIFYSEDLSPDELLVIAGRSGIGGIDMAAYERAAAASREADAAVDNVWEAIVRRERETR